MTSDGPGIPRSLQSRAPAAARAGARIRRRISRHRRAARRPRRRAHGSDDRGPARGRGLPRRPRAAQAQARVSGVHQQPARAARPELSGADALGDAREDRSAVRRSGAARRPAHRARLLSRRHLSRARPPRRLPLSPDLRHHAVAVRHHRRRVLHQRPAPLQALGLSAGPDVVAGLRLSLTHRTAARLEDETAGRAGCRRRRTPGSPAAAPRSFRSICSAARRTRSRSTSSSSPTASASSSAISTSSAIRSSCPAPSDCLVQLGFDEPTRFLPNDKRIFRGFDLLREYFMFPRKFLGFQLTKLDAGDAAADGEDRSTSCSRSTR